MWDRWQRHKLTVRSANRHASRNDDRTRRASPRQQLIAGCEQNFYLGSKSASLTVADSGGRIVQHTTPDGNTVLHVVGGHISALVLHSRRHDVGFFDCL